jgi:glutathione peroxidase
MKHHLQTLSLLILGIAGINCFQSAEKPSNMYSKKSIYEYSFKAIDGSALNFSQFKGKKILIVNVASECGFTPQYEDLEKLYRQYKEKLVVVGFPANNFMGQEPGSNEEIAAFCKSKYGVTFPMAEKISVVGDDQNYLYKWLTDKSLNGWNELAPKWNFYKYLISENGELLKVFPSTTKPLSKDITDLL